MILNKFWIRIQSFEPNLATNRRTWIRAITKYPDLQLRPYLKPWIGFCLHMLHLAWCRALSAAENLNNKEIKIKKKEQGQIFPKISSQRTRKDEERELVNERDNKRERKIGENKNC